VKETEGAPNACGPSKPERREKTERIPKNLEETRWRKKIPQRRSMQKKGKFQVWIGRYAPVEGEKDARRRQREIRRPRGEGEKSEREK